MKTHLQLVLLAVGTLLPLPCVHAQTGVVAGVSSPQTTTTVLRPDTPPVMPAVPGEKLDRIVAIVNGDLILDSDVNAEDRFEEMLQIDSKEKMTREQLIERLINRDLLLQQARLQPETDVSDEQLQKGIDGLKKNLPVCARFHCETQGGWEKMLDHFGFTEEAIRERWRLRMQTMTFIEERFRQGIHISDTEIENFYEISFVPQFTVQGVKPPSLDAVKDRIQEVLLEQQVTNLLGDWLNNLRAQGQVVVLHPEEAAP